MKTFVKLQNGSIVQLDNEKGITADIVLHFYGDGMHELLSVAEKTINEMVLDGVDVSMEGFIIEKHIIVPVL
jgi:hypothetical protein